MKNTSLVLAPGGKPLEAKRLGRSFHLPSDHKWARTLIQFTLELDTVPANVRLYLKHARGPLHWKNRLFPAADFRAYDIARSCKR